MTHKTNRSYNRRSYNAGTTVHDLEAQLPSFDFLTILIILYCLIRPCIQEKCNKAGFLMGHKMDVVCVVLKDDRYIVLQKQICSGLLCYIMEVKL